MAAWRQRTFDLRSALHGREKWERLFNRPETSSFMDYINGHIYAACEERDAIQFTV